jgi:hypothetical protein
VGASDVAKLLLSLVYVLDGLRQPELKVHNHRQIRARDRVRDSFRPIIGGINSYLHAYHMYRAEALRVPKIDRLDTMSWSALEKLQTVFPFGVRLKNWLFRSWFCTEKLHSMVRWADNNATVGRIRIMSTSVTETRMKSAVKIPARKTNNQASLGYSILKNNMETEAEIELSRHLDETGLHIAYTFYQSSNICLLIVFVSWASSSSLPTSVPPAHKKTKIILRRVEQSAFLHFKLF